MLPRSIRPDPATTGIVLICDFNYLLYTLVCACQASQHSPSDTDVRIFLDAAPETSGLTSRIAEITGLSIDLVPEALQAEVRSIRPHTDYFSQSHLSRSALLRLKIADLVGDAYGRVLYLDGDIQVRNSLAPLLMMESPPGGFLAVRDWKAYQSHAGMPEVSEERARLTALGLSEDRWSSYFNTGVMLGDMQAWREVGPMALDYYRAHPDRCATYDQCALNAVAFDRVRLISSRWNYLRALMALPIYREIDPAIVHFGAPPKPWNGPMRPWGQAGFAPYREMANRLKSLDLPWDKLPLWRRMKWEIGTHLKREFTDQAYRQRLDSLIRMDLAT